MTETRINGRVLRVAQGDITQFTADAIVNAANSALMGGGGVDGAIHEEGGPSIMAELDVIRAKQGKCPAGQAVVTGAGNLPAKFVFHAVGPYWQGGAKGEPEALASCYKVCLRLADERHVETIAFPAISTGVYFYPMEKAAALALEVVAAHLKSETSIREATFVLYGSAAYEIWEDELKTHFAEGSS